ncbi:MAG: hypothetical protein ACKO81_05425, partial [Planctomycetota bacterium]
MGGGGFGGMGMGGSGGWGLGGMGGFDGSVVGGVQGKYVIRTIGGQQYVFIEGQPSTAYLMGSPECQAAIDRVLNLPSKVDPSGNPAGQSSNSDGN